MESDIFWIYTIKKARIGIMPRPRGGDWLEEEVQFLKQSEVDVVVSLLESVEIKELGLEDERLYCEANDIAFVSYPIKDRSVPESRQETFTYVNRVNRLIESDKNVVIHCRQGIGRSSLFAALILASNGVDVKEAFEMIKEARGCNVPDTREQYDWVCGIVENLVKKVGGEDYV